MDFSVGSSVPVSGTHYTAAGHGPLQWAIATEVPVALMFNSSPYAVMMATPADLEDFAVGFALSEGLCEGEAIKGVIVLPGEAGMTVDVALQGSVQAPRRAMEGRSGCGLCGVEEIAQVLRPMGPVARKFSLDPMVAVKVLSELGAHQPINRENRSVHGAVWVSPAGDILHVREDVGRHNALDKLIGALARQGVDFGSGFVAMTSRCSFELVQKAATVGISHLVTLSAPTSLALAVAQQAGLVLGARAGDGIVMFSAEEV